MSIELEPAERMALTVGRAQVERGERPTASVAAACIMALARLADGKSFEEAYGAAPKEPTS